MSSHTLQASAEAARLPSGARVVFTARDYSIIELAASEDGRTVQRIIVVYDADRDLRILDALGAFYLRDRELCLNLVGLAETKGYVSYWWSNPATVDYSRIPLIAAVKAALWPSDRWDTHPPILVDMTPAGVVDIDNLPGREPGSLIRCAPHRYPLGRVTVKS
jgi:hypothetical protein